MSYQTNLAVKPHRMGHKIGLLVFRLGEVAFGVDRELVIEVVDPQQIAYSSAPPFAEGLFHYQDQPLLVIRLDKRLGLSSTASSSNLLIISLDQHLTPIGIPVDSVVEEEVVLPVEQIEPLPRAIERKMSLKCIWGVAAWGQGLMMLISLSQVLTNKEKNWLICEPAAPQA